MSTIPAYTFWPVEITVSTNKKSLIIEFDDSSIFTYPAEFLRVESPSAETKGHGTFQKKIISKCQNVKIASIEKVGNYAIRIIFDDNHTTGIYTWAYLYELGENYDEIWNRYLQLIESFDLSRI